MAFRKCIHRIKNDMKSSLISSFVAAIEFSQPVRAKALLSYGNSSQRGSPHHTDQLSYYSRKELRPVWRSRAEIEAHLESKW
jgi:acyl-homoserine-lactone acylase